MITYLRRAGIYSRRPHTVIHRCMFRQTGSVDGRRSGRLETVPYGMLDGLRAFVGAGFQPARTVPASSDVRSIGLWRSSEGGRDGQRPSPTVSTEKRTQGRRDAPPLRDVR